MADTAPTTKLTFEGAQKLLAAAIAKARELNVPQCICIVDAGGHLLTMGRMDGAFALSIETALRKAKTAAAYGIPTGGIAPALEIKLALGTDGQRINLLGGGRIIQKKKPPGTAPLRAVGVGGRRRDRQRGPELAQQRLSARVERHRPERR